MDQGSTTVTVANTMAFTNDSLWVGDQLSCTGYTNTTLTGCTLATTVANNATLTTSARVVARALGGFIKVERGNVDGTWTDVTMEILNNGTAGPNLAGAACGDPTPNAILRLQRLRDNALATCYYGAGTVQRSTDLWPNVLFDTREAVHRDTAAAGLTLAGTMHYATLDVVNVAKWFAGTAPYAAGTGNQSRIDNTGFTVYFSDRRTNRNASSAETGEYGWVIHEPRLSGTGTRTPRSTSGGRQRERRARHTAPSQL
jgi:hypothetical protein